MGRETKTFRQTNKAGRADAAAKSYAKINRRGGWGIVNRMSNIVRGKNRLTIDDKR